MSDCLLCNAFYVYLFYIKNFLLSNDFVNSGGVLYISAEETGYLSNK